MRLYKFFTHSNAYRWIDALPDIINGINHSINRTTGRRPVDVQTGDLPDPRRLFKGRPKFRVGDVVRYLKFRGPFEKGYLKNFKEERVVISAVKSKYIPVYYHVVDLQNNKIDGSFYDQELVLCPNPTDVFKIEKILKERKVRGVKQYFVRWLGYDQSFDSWVNAKDVNKL